VRLGLASSPVTVRLLGGDLVIEVEEADEGLQVFMTGPAEEIFTCELSDELLRRLSWPAPANE
jgi:diaminopimelate epimerase